MADRAPHLVAGILSEERARRVAAFALSRVSADDAVLNLAHRREATTRISNNAIAQGMHRNRCTATLTVAFGNRGGSASVDSLEDDALRELIQRAEAIARVAPPDPEFLPSLGPQEYPAVPGPSDATAAMTEDDAARIALRIIRPAADGGCRASGTIETVTRADAVATKNGLFAHHAGTMAHVGCTATAGDSSGWARDAAADVTRIDPDALAATAVDVARRSASPQPIEPGRYTTLFLPAAAAHLVYPLIGLAQARVTLEGLTFLAGRAGEKLAGDDITVTSDPGAPELPCAPFDEEGVPRRPLAWIDAGVFRQMSWDRWTARANGVDPVPPPGPLSMEGTDRSVEELIRGIDRGVLVTRVWYVRLIKQDQTLLTGMTRDGTFWIEDGTIRHPIRNLRFNDTSLGVVQRTVAIGRPARCVPVDTPPGIYPPLVVRDWNFVGVTGF